MHVHPNREAFGALLAKNDPNPVVMLNLLRFKDQADYSGAPELAPETPITGRQAYQRYAAHTMPFLALAGSEVLFLGDAGAALIGPTDEAWDQVLLVRHASMAAFVQFATNAEYLVGTGHRTAALADSRLIPVAAK